jgi:hypothetical protein
MRRVSIKACHRAAVCFCLVSIIISCLWITGGFSQEGDIEVTLDSKSNTVTLPKIFKPYIDLSGRGSHDANSWPKGLSAAETLAVWQKDIGFSGIYRLQYNLWEINECAQEKALQEELLANYEAIIKKISDAGGIVILDIFGTPAGLGKVLDKKSPSVDLAAFKEFVKNHVRELSCNKKYTIWYEVWSAPDLDDFFLGKKQEYFAMYRAVAEGIKELEAESKIKIPIGGPGVSWWFQNCEGNNVMTPEKSLIYDLIKYCYSYHLPLDFITWHAYSTDPKAEQEVTRYNKTSVALVRDWLSYFNFDKNTPLIVDEWNYDSGSNYLSARQENSYICASFIPARLKNMYETGLDCQLYFSLEDFNNRKEHVVRNTGVFRFSAAAPAGYTAGPKSIYNVFRMLAGLSNNMYVLPAKLTDEFVGVIATKQDENIEIIVYNYIDPALAKNYLSRTIATLNDAERKILLNLIKSDGLEKIIGRKMDVSSLRATKKLKTMLKNAQELNILATIYKASDRNVKLSVKNLKEKYIYQKYAVDSSSNAESEFKAVEEKEISGSGVYQEVLKMPPYSVYMIVLKKKPKDVEVVVPVTTQLSAPTEAAGDKAEGTHKKPKETAASTDATSPAASTETVGNKGNIISKPPKEMDLSPQAIGHGVPSEVTDKKDDTTSNNLKKTENVPETASQDIETNAVSNPQDSLKNIPKEAKPAPEATPEVSHAEVTGKQVNSPE